MATTETSKSSGKGEPSSPQDAKSREHVKAAEETPKEEEEDKEEDTKPAELPVIDSETFEQLLELDEDDEHEFSKQMAWEYFGQMEVTLTKLDKALDKKDLLTLSSLGHFLKGSSAALGAARVQQLCENIQYYGELKDHRAGKTLEEAQALELIETALANVKEEYAAAEEWLKTWYKRHLVQVA